MQSLNLSAVVLTRNNEKYLASCLVSLAFVDELIVVDDDSTDNTVQIAEKFGARIFKRALRSDFASQRNFGLNKAEGQWVLFIDSDEIITPELKSEIVQATKNPFYCDGFYLKRMDSIWGRTLKHGETGSVKFLRLAKKGKGYWHRKVHETWQVLGPTDTLKSPILHYPHQSLHEFIGDINEMSNIDVEAKKEEKKRSSIAKIIFWPKGKFIWNWKFKLGFLDGTQGFIMALMMSFHSFLSWSKLWVEQRHSQ